VISENQIQDVMSATAYDRSGDKIGRVGQVYLDDSTGAPEWATVNTGLFGTSESFVPLSEANLDGDRLTLAVEKQQVKDAPNIGTDGHLSPEQETELYRYYRVADVAGTETAGYDTTTTQQYAGERGTVGRDTSGPTTDDAMTLSEERLRVGTTAREAGRARLRKYIVTENVSHTVPVSREEVTLQREPITDANAGNAYDGPALSEEEHEVTLHAEQAVVEKDTVPVERIRLGKETVTEQQTVTDQVRKEEVDLDTDGTTTSRGDLR